MSEENLTNSEQNTEPSEQFEELTVSEAITGVFTAPGDTFETIANSPKKKLLANSSYHFHCTCITGNIYIHAGRSASK